MPYISTKKNKQIFNLKSKIDSNFESDNYEVIKLYDLDMDKIKALEQYSNIPGTILYNPWSANFHLYTNGMNLEVKETDQETYGIFTKYMRNGYRIYNYTDTLGSTGIPGHNFNGFFSTDLFKFFKKNYHHIVDSNWSRWTVRSKGFPGANYTGGSSHLFYLFSDKYTGGSDIPNFSIDFVLACLSCIGEARFKSMARSNYKKYFFVFLGIIKKILIFEQMKSNRNFSDLLSILPKEGILHNDSRVSLLGMDHDYLISFFYSLIENPKFIDQIEIINKSNLSQFSFEDFSNRLITMSYPRRIFDSLDLSLQHFSFLDNYEGMTVGDRNPYFEQFISQSVNRTTTYQEDSLDFKSFIQDFDPNPVIYWQPFRFNVATKYNNYESFDINFGYRDPRNDIAYLYIASSAYNASNNASCSVLMVPRNPTDNININPVCHYYS
jgi:hypothetical protein